VGEENMSEMLCISEHVRNRLRFRQEKSFAFVELKKKDINKAKQKISL